MLGFTQEYRASAALAKQAFGFVHRSWPRMGVAMLIVTGYILSTEAVKRRYFHR